MLWHLAFAGRVSAVSDVMLVVCSIAGSIAAIATWMFSCVYLARMRRFDLVVSMRYDALAYAGFVAYPIVSLLPLGESRELVAFASAATLYVAGTLVAIARFDAAMRSTLWLFSITKIPIVGIALISTIFIPQNGSGHPVLSPYPALNVFARWDAVHYLDIARRGYSGTDFAFFPLYPLLIRIGGAFLGSDIVAGLLLSNVSFLCALYFLYRIAEAQFDSETARRASLYLAIFPTAFFFTSLYSESLFLALSLAMFYYLRENKWLLAGFLGGLATLTRIEGVLLVACYIVEVLAPERHLFAALRTSAVTRKHLGMGAAMIPGGLIAFMLLSWALSNDPLAFSHVQAHWHRHLAWPWTSLVNSLIALVTSHNAPTVAVQGVEFLFALLVIATTVYGFRRIRPSYTAYAVLSLIVPLSTATLMSTPRFALAIFPVFLILGKWGSRQRVNDAILVVALPFLGLFTVLFANWYWVA